jgi:hypothetical protein
MPENTQHVLPGMHILADRLRLASDVVKMSVWIAAELEAFDFALSERNLGARVALTSDNGLVSCGA